MLHGPGMKGLSRRRSSAWLFAAGLLAGATSWGEPARARDCASDADCPKGFGCQVGASASSIPPFPATVATPTANGPSPACVSLECHTDADCGDGTRCELDVSTLCTTSPDGGSSCTPGNMCVPAWQARCKTDSECGAGFTCSGTDGYDELASPSEASVPAYAMATSVPCVSLLPPVVPPNVNLNPRDASTCSSITWSTCVAMPTGPCAVDTDCPATWTCACPPALSVGGEGLPAAGNETGDASGPLIDAACVSQCQPPNADLQPVYGSGGGASFNGGSPDNTPSAAVADAGAMARSASADSPGTTASQGGCQVVAGDAGAALPWATLLGLVVAHGVGTKRRRR